MLDTSGLSILDKFSNLPPSTGSGPVSYVDMEGLF